MIIPHFPEYFNIFGKYFLVEYPRIFALVFVHIAQKIKIKENAYKSRVTAHRMSELPQETKYKQKSVTASTVTEHYIK